MFKKFSLAIMCIAMLLSLVACSKDEAHQNDGATNQTENALTNDVSQPSKPTQKPTAAMTEAPTQAPTQKPTQAPTQKPTAVPTEAPTQAPTQKPSQVSTQKPTATPTEAPTAAPTEEPSKPTEEKAVFKTEDIIRITFYGYYGGGKGSDVPADNMTEIINWLGSFTIGEKAPDILPPGTNTYYVEIEYSDGMIIKNGLDIRKIDGNTFYLERNKEPECFMEIISKISFN